MEFPFLNFSKQPKEIRVAVAKTIWELPHGFKPTSINVDLKNKTVTYYYGLLNSKAYKFE